MNICLVGHRGVGKTTYLKRVTSRATFDLDREVERRRGLSVDEIFAREGEAAFRDLERACLAELLARPGAKLIALGAGYDGPKPQARVVWLRRETDAAGRVFLDRPRLNPDLDPLDEYLARFPEREARYSAWADQTLTLPEGYDGGLESLIERVPRVDADVTVRPGENLGVLPRRVEWRDDLGGAVPAGPRVLRSHRGGTAGPVPEADDEDWALELGPPVRRVSIVSIHEGDVATAVARFETIDEGVLKLAVEVKSFGELMTGHRWWAEDPNRRAFLPRSPDGRWRWYRSLFGPRMPIHFVREAGGTAADQPLVCQALLQTPFTRDFAAVLGSPVAHSRTPLAQRAYFARLGMPVVAIDVREDEWAEAWPILRALGLTHAAVTAPLKTKVVPSCDTLDARAARLQSVNTLFVGDRVRGANTDAVALEELSRAHPGGVTWLWGGGGVKPAVRAAWPHAREISARVGVDGETAAPDLLIWAAPRAREHKTPPPSVAPRLVLDLNYADDSPGKAWAASRGLPYVSGLEMFERQAAAQREFWDACAREVLGAREHVR